MDKRDDFVRTSLRLPKELHDQLSEAAGRRRSLNAEILARLESSFPPEPPDDYLEIAREGAEKSELNRLLYEALVLVSQAREIMLKEDPKPDPTPD